MLSVYDLKTEYLKNPVGIDVSEPRFSWKLKSNRTGVKQNSYRISAWSDDRLIWDSGIIASGISQRIRYAGDTLCSRQIVSWQVEVVVQDENCTSETAVSETAFFEMGLLSKSDWICKWIEPELEVDPEQRKPSPYLRKIFTVKPNIKSARIYQTAHGLYEFWINGQRGTEDKFKPGLTSYYYRIQYQTYDITRILQEGKNVWTAKLGDGWWRGCNGGTVKNSFGYKLHYFGQIELNYEDGSREIISTDEMFKTSTGGLIASDMQMGDIFDASLEPTGWQLGDFDDIKWHNVKIVSEHADANLISSRSVPVREKETFSAVSFRDNADNLVLDFSQNIAGYVKMKLRGCRKGQKIRLVHGEDIDADGNFSISNINKTSLKLDAFQEVVYFASGAEVEEYCPEFAIFGFRYVLLEGYDGEIIDDDFIAVAVYSDMETTGAFKCSHPLINKLVQNSLWSQKGNFMDVAVDCPTRERNAWTGDSQIYVRTACDFMNVYPFFEKWLQDQAIEQYASGKLGITFPSTSSLHNPEELAKVKKANPLAELAGPTGNGNIGEDCAGWGDSAVWNPYILYLCYGDEQILQNQYETAKKWVNYMLVCAKDHNPLYESQPQYHTWTDGELDADYIYDTRMHYGEWQEPIAKENTEEQSLGEAFARLIREGNPLVATAYMCRSSDNLAFMAQILGYDEDYSKYEKIANRIRRTYEKYLIAEDGTIQPGHQAAYVRALAIDLFSIGNTGKREAVTNQLINEIEKNNYCLNTGFLSTPYLLPILSDIGREDLAYRLLEQTDNPSWLHPITLGSTTILESWDGMDRHEGSYNHYSYGSVCDFLFAYTAGIRPRFDAPGYKEFDLKPVIGGSLTYAEASYESIYGLIVSGWQKNSNLINYYCQVPPCTRAHLILPNGEIHQLGSGYYKFTITL